MISEQRFIVLRSVDPSRVTAFQATEDLEETCLYVNKKAAAFNAAQVEKGLQYHAVHMWHDGTSMFSSNNELVKLGDWLVFSDGILVGIYSPNAFTETFGVGPITIAA
ncbi:hypothetical protein [Bradyrhizobium sp. HKCCYLS3013]|uniref:hypothetical protein n=1 Tax=Bradyrhizobium sp. HKCCYLS3013 TaxID=3420735 RepID=UPI003EB767D7